MARFSMMVFENLREKGAWCSGGLISSTVHVMLMYILTHSIVQ